MDNKDKCYLVVWYLNEDNERVKYNLYVEHPIMYDYLGFKHFVIAEEGFIAENEHAYHYIPPHRIVEIVLIKRLVGNQKMKGIDEFAIVKVNGKGCEV